MNKQIISMTVLLIMSLPLHCEDLFRECQVKIVEEVVGPLFDDTINVPIPGWTLSAENGCVQSTGQPYHLDIQNRKLVSFAVNNIHNLDHISASLAFQNISDRGLAQLKKRMELCQTRLVNLHKDAMLASKDVYNLSRYRQDKNALNIPPGYELARAVFGRETGEQGLLAYILKPKAGTVPKKPYILAFAGTRSARTAAADLGFGTDIMSEARSLLASQSEIMRALRDGEDVVITGHSLGGGLAQAAAAQLARNVALRQAQDQKLAVPPKWGNARLVTFNAFGAKQLDKYLIDTSKQEIEAIDLLSEQFNINEKKILSSKEYQSSLKRIQENLLDQSVHYRMENDPVSKLGSHFGEQRTSQTVKIVNPLSAHFLTTLEDSLNETGYQNTKRTKGNVLGVGDRVTAFYNWIFARGSKEGLQKVLERFQTK